MRVYLDFLTFADGTNFDLSTLESVEQIEKLIARIKRKEKQKYNNKQEVISHLESIISFLKGEVIFACNAFHGKPESEPLYLRGYAYENGEVKHCKIAGSVWNYSEESTEINLSLYQLSQYTPLKLVKYIKE